LYQTPVRHRTDNAVPGAGYSHFRQEPGLIIAIGRSPNTAS